MAEALAPPPWLNTSHSVISAGVLPQRLTRHCRHRKVAFHSPRLHSSSRSPNLGKHAERGLGGPAMVLSLRYTKLPGSQSLARPVQWQWQLSQTDHLSVC